MYESFITNPAKVLYESPRDPQQIRSVPIETTCQDAGTCSDDTLQCIQKKQEILKDTTNELETSFLQNTPPFYKTDAYDLTKQKVNKLNPVIDATCYNKNDIDKVSHVVLSFDIQKPETDFVLLQGAPTCVNILPQILPYYSVRDKDGKTIYGSFVENNLQEYKFVKENGKVQLYWFNKDKDTWIKHSNELCVDIIPETNVLENEILIEVDGQDSSSLSSSSPIPSLLFVPLPWKFLWGLSLPTHYQKSKNNILQNTLSISSFENDTMNSISDIMKKLLENGDYLLIMPSQSPDINHAWYYEQSVSYDIPEWKSNININDKWILLLKLVNNSYIKDAFVFTKATGTAMATTNGLNYRKALKYVQDKERTIYNPVNKNAYNFLQSLIRTNYMPRLPVEKAIYIAPDAVPSSTIEEAVKHGFWINMYYEESSHTRKRLPIMRPVRPDMQDATGTQIIAQKDLQIFYPQTETQPMGYCIQLNKKNIIECWTLLQFPEQTDKIQLKAEIMGPETDTELRVYRGFFDHEIIPLVENIGSAESTVLTVQPRGSMILSWVYSWKASVSYANFGCNIQWRHFNNQNTTESANQYVNISTAYCLAPYRYCLTGVSDETTGTNITVGIPQLTKGVPEIMTPPVSKTGIIQTTDLVVIDPFVLWRIKPVISGERSLSDFLGEKSNRYYICMNGTYENEKTPYLSVEPNDSKKIGLTTFSLGLRSLWKIVYVGAGWIIQSAYHGLFISPDAIQQKELSTPFILQKSLLLSSVPFKWALFEMPELSSLVKCQTN